MNVYLLTIITELTFENRTITELPFSNVKNSYVTINKRAVYLAPSVGSTFVLVYKYKLAHTCKVTLPEDSEVAGSIESIGVIITRFTSLHSFW